MLHTDLPIYRTGTQLLSVAYRAQMHMPRGMKRSLGEKICEHCTEMLNHMALANATQATERARHIHALLERHRAVQVLLRVGHDSKWVSRPIWAESVELLDSVGRQAGGWLKRAKGSQYRKAPAA